MEYTFWSGWCGWNHNPWGCLNPYFNGIYFLILIAFAPTVGKAVVLILILMEYTFWWPLKLWTKKLKKCLNPYFNGIYFLIHVHINRMIQFISLNPYFNGIYFLIASRGPWRRKILVLILILMEYTFWWVPQARKALQWFDCLNPYFNGIYFLIFKI